MEISIIKDYKKVYAYKTTNKMCCLTAPILAYKLFDFKLLGLNGWTMFGISPALIGGIVGIATLVTLASMFAGNGFSVSNMIENDGRNILLLISAIAIIIAIMAVDFHIYI